MSTFDLLPFCFLVHSSLLKENGSKPRTDFVSDTTVNTKREWTMGTFTIVKCLVLKSGTAGVLWVDTFSIQKMHETLNTFSQLSINFTTTRLHCHENYYTSWLVLFYWISGLETCQLTTRWSSIFLKKISLRHAIHWGNVLQTWSRIQQISGATNPLYSTVIRDLLYEICLRAWSYLPSTKASEGGLSGWFTRTMFTCTSNYQVLHNQVGGLVQIMTFSSKHQPFKVQEAS